MQGKAVVANNITVCNKSGVEACFAAFEIVIAVLRAHA